ncbi:unnamed protein product [Calypogeia fissa]
MDVKMEDLRVFHQRAHSDPHFFQDLNLTHSDDETGNFPTQMESEKRDESSGFPSQMGSGRRDEVSSFPTQMGSGRRDARVVCETFSSGRHFLIAASPKMRQSASQRGFKANVRRRTLAYSRHPLLACFLGESVVSSRDIHLSSNCDSSGGSQRTFFSLIPVDTSRVNEKTGEPQSPQLSCIGQVKQRQVKTAKEVEAVANLARMDINDGVIPHSMQISKTDSTAIFAKRQSFKLHKGESFRLQKEESFRLQSEESFKLKNVESFKLRKEESFKVQKEESFRRQKEESSRLQKEFSLKLQKKQVPFSVSVNDIPHLDLAGRNTLDENLSYFDSGCAKNSARLMRCKRVAEEEEKKIDEEEKVKSPGQKNSMRYLNHFLKQKLGASMVKAGFVCGWSSGEVSPTSPKSEGSDSESEHCEIDLSRFASGDFPPKTPSFKDTRFYQHVTGKKLPEIKVRCHQQPEGATNQRSWKDETEGKEQNDVSMISSKCADNSIPYSNITIKWAPSAVLLQPATEAALWKRRCMPRLLDLEIPT